MRCVLDQATTTTTTTLDSGFTTLGLTSLFTSSWISFVVAARVLLGSVLTVVCLGRSCFESVDFWQVPENSSLLLLVDLFDWDSCEANCFELYLSECLTVSSAVWFQDLEGACCSIDLWGPILDCGDSLRL